MPSKKKQRVHWQRREAGEPADTDHVVERRGTRHVSKKEQDRCLKVGKRTRLSNGKLRYYDDTTGVVVITDANGLVSMTTWRCDGREQYSSDDDGIGMPLSAVVKHGSVNYHMHKHHAKIRSLYR